VHLELLPLAGQEVQQALQERRLPLQPAVARMTAASGRKLGHAPESNHKAQTRIFLSAKRHHGCGGKTDLGLHPAGGVSASDQRTKTSRNTTRGPKNM
jgi:hypothetical protein